jgi:cephalosporin hydroxylase
MQFRRRAQRTTAEQEADLPPSVAMRLDAPVRELWMSRAHQHSYDTYAGVRISKFPEDLRAYEHLLWTMQADTVVEIGTWHGGSALWFRDRLRAMRTYGRIGESRVVSIDMDQTLAEAAIHEVDPDHEAITLLEADVCDPTLPNRVRELLPEGARCLVVEDSQHVYDTTYAALAGFADLVPLGGYFVAEDGCVDVEEMRLEDSWPRGVLPAVADWLETPGGRRFEVRRDLELYGISCHPGGFLQRVR